MNEKEVKEMIGEDNWVEFLSFMRGQTVGINNDGSTDFYTHDVVKFMKLYTRVYKSL